VAFIAVGGSALRQTNAPAYVRLPGADAIRIGDGQQFAIAGPTTLLLQRFDSRVQAYRVAQRPELLYERVNQGGPPRGIAFGDEIYEIQHGGLVATDRLGKTRDVWIPSTVPGSVSCANQKGPVLDPSATVTWALAATAGHLFAFAASPANGAIFDLTDGRRIDLPASGPALAMTVGSDGKLYALTAARQCGSSSPVVRRIDLVSMREEAVIDIARLLPLVRAAIVSTRGAIYVHLVTEDSAELLRVNAGSVTPLALPPDSGLMSSAAPDGSIWLFGGRARNLVSRFDPSTGRVEHATEADAPDGSFVGAVLFRDAAAAR
jgi:hypothetical protein